MSLPNGMPSMLFENVYRVDFTCCSSLEHWWRRELKRSTWFLNKEKMKSVVVWPSSFNLLVYIKRHLPVSCTCRILQLMWKFIILVCVSLMWLRKPQNTTCHHRLTSTHRPPLPSVMPSLWSREDGSMSCADGKAGILNFAWIPFEVSGDKKGARVFMFIDICCMFIVCSKEEQEARYNRTGLWKTSIKQKELHTKKYPIYILENFKSDCLHFLTDKNTVCTMSYSAGSNRGYRVVLTGLATFCHYQL